jgi:ketosteroid isomerase-like protein
MSAAPVTTDLEAFVDAFDTNWRAGGPARAFVERFTPLLDPNVRLIQPQVPTLVGLEAFERGFAEPLFELMPDARGAVRGWAARGEDVLYVEVDVGGCIAGRKVVLHSCDRLKLREGRIAERVAFLDPSPIVKAVGLRPSAWPTFLRTQIANRRFR